MYNQDAVLLIDTHLKEGKRHKKAGELELATDRYLNVLSLDSNSIPALVNLAEIYQSRQDLNKAIQYRQQLVQLQPDNSLNWSKLADTFIEIGLIEDAVIAYQKSIWLPNPPISVYKRLANAFAKLDRMNHQIPKEQLKEIANDYHNLIEKIDSTNINPVPLYINLGRILAKAGNISAAIECNTKAGYYRVKKYYPELTNSDQAQKNTKPPSFLLIGAMKCGTTALYDYIAQHPQVIPAIFKEIHFFDKFFKEDKIDSIKLETYSVDLLRKLYLSYFLPIKKTEEVITGEATPAYIRLPNLEKIVYSMFPDIKLIVILRNPVERAISNYHMKTRTVLKRKSKKLEYSLEETINFELEKLESNPNDLVKVIEEDPNKILTKGLYVYQLQRWMKFFSKEQFLILRTEDLSEDPAAVMKQVFEFLDLPDYQQIQYSRKNKGTYSSKIDEGLLSRLYDFYRPHNQRLEELLRRKFNWD